MKLNYLFLFLFLTILACQPKTSAPSTALPEEKSPDTLPSLPKESNTTILRPKGEEPYTQKNPYPKTHNCQVQGKALLDNDFFIPSEQLYLSIVADEETFDEEFGEGYRLFDVYATDNCQQLDRIVLPVNNAPDFPWYLSPETYNEHTQQLCTLGYEFTFCYDVKRRKMLAPYKPTFLTERLAYDAQTGRPLALKAYDKYIFGFAQDLGAFAFDSQEQDKKSKSIKAVAEYELSNRSRYHTLFMLAQDKAYQAIIPIYDQNTGTLSLSPLFTKPIALDPSVEKKYNTLRFQVFQNNENKEWIIIDLKKATLLPLPTNLNANDRIEIIKKLNKLS